MSKYDNLTAYLVEAGAAKSPLQLSFDQIERIIRAPLPDSARRYQAWWANQSGKGHSQAFSWACAGWRTSELDLEGETVTFRYIAEEMAREHFAAQKSSKASATKGISIDEAKQRLATTFGVPTENIEIVVRM